MIDAYLKEGICYVATIDSRVIGAVVLHRIDATRIEIKNLAVDEVERGRGIGTALLRHAERISRELGFDVLIIGTGNSSLDQLALYQKEGFEMCRIEPNFFLTNYSEPIVEHGIRCKHLVVLEKKLNEE